MGSPAPVAVVRTTESEYLEAKFTASLRAGRKIDAAPQIDQQIDDKAIKIKCLDTQREDSASREAMAGPEGGSRETLG